VTDDSQHHLSDNCYGILEGGQRLLFNFYATDDVAAIAEARSMGYGLDELRALRNGKWQEVKP